MEDAAHLEIAAREKTIDHYSHTADPNQIAYFARSGKSMALLRLAMAYRHEGKMAFALSTADEAFRYGSEVQIGDSLLKACATLGLELANKAQDSRAISLWQERVATLRSAPDVTIGGDGPLPNPRPF